ncbi:DUF523 domain-containing protein [Streptomyces sp. NPDC059906]|uniref:DUF523 domain-containing protein n=1 Tax=Streptomyces sp. NPDC059906 TaxID=3346997 RepID=UPI00365AB64A
MVFRPKVSGGLPVPRPAAEIVGGDGDGVLDGVARVLTESGEDVSLYFVRGARLALEAARAAGVRVALLKESSPSCGSLRVYDGRFSGTRVPGHGVTTALLRRAGCGCSAKGRLPRRRPAWVSLKMPVPCADQCLSSTNTPR